MVGVLLQRLISIGGKMLRGGLLPCHPEVCNCKNFVDLSFTTPRVVGVLSEYPVCGVIRYTREVLGLV